MKNLLERSLSVHRATIFRFLILLPFFLLLWKQSAVATEYFVSTEGNDENPGTLSTPWKAIRFGISKLVAGDILTVRGGTYVENLSGNSGTEEKFIEVRNFQGETPIVQGAFVVQASYFRLNGLTIKNQSLAIIQGSTNVEILNCTIQDAPIHGLVIDGSKGDVRGVKIANCTVTGSGKSAIRGAPDNLTVQKYDITIEDCMLFGNGEDGINLANAENVNIRRNKIHSNKEEGIDIKQHSNFTTIEDNEVYNNSSGGIMINVTHSDQPPPIKGGTNVIIRRNHISNCGINCIRLNSKEAGGYFFIDHNLVVPGSSTADGIYLFRGIGLKVYNNTIVGGNKGIVGSCLRDSIIQNNTVVDSAAESLLFQGSSNDCTGYTNGLITEGHNNWQSLGTHIIRWVNGHRYTASELVTYRSDTGQGLGTLSENPKFIDKVTYALASDSPLIDTGLNIPGITDSYDGANPDLGYREFKKAKSINKPQNLRIGGTSSE